MKNKFIILVLALVLLTVIGLVVFRFFKSDKSSPITNLKSSPSPSISIPKVEKFAVPILMYHYIRNAPANDQLGANLSVSPENFQAQMKYLKDDNFATVKLADLADPNRQAISRVYYEKKKPIVISFDDGYDDAYTKAFPTLKNFGFIGTFFIIKDYTGHNGRLNLPQIDEMAQAGMEFGSHTLTHPDLTKINIDDAKNQIVNSKGDWLIFCYPAGKYNQDTVNLVKDAGYLVAVTTKIGIANENSNLFELRRIRVENVSPQALMDKISYAYESGQY